MPFYIKHPSNDDSVRVFSVYYYKYNFTYVLYFYYYYFIILYSYELCNSANSFLFSRRRTAANAGGSQIIIVQCVIVVGWYRYSVKRTSTCGQRIADFSFLKWVRSSNRALDMYFTGSYG